MNKYLLFLLIFVTILSCKKETVQPEDTFEYTGALGDIIRIVREEQLTVAQIQALLPSEISFLVNIKNDVTVFTVEYKSLNMDEDTVKASGIIIVAKADSFSIPLISYQHGTVLEKSQAPSVRYNNNREYLLNLAVASSGGAVVCVPDYLGLGTGDGLHMYLNPEEEANSVRDLLRAARKIVKERNIGVFNGQVFLYGYSQGGHATMATQRLLELENANEFKLTATAPMAGPYAMSRTKQFDVMLDSSYYPNPFYLPYLVVSLFNAYPLYSSYSQLFKAPYDTRIPIALDGFKSFQYANTQFDYYVSNMLIDSIKIGIKNNPNHPIRIALKGYDLVDDWTPKAPMKLYHCNGDDNVFFENAVYADSAFRSRGADVELIDLGSANHDDCAPTAFLVGINWLSGLLQPVRIK